MHRRETRVLLRHYLEQGVSKTELAKRFGISRRTVYHWIETGQLDRDLDNQEVRYRARPPVTTRLDPYKPIIQARLEAFPLLTAQRSEEHTSELQSRGHLVCRLLLEKKKKNLKHVRRSSTQEK